MAGLSPLQLLQQYRSLRVPVGVEANAKLRQCIIIRHSVQLRTYLINNGKHAQKTEYVLSGVSEQAKDVQSWFRANRGRIHIAAVGKGAPRDYELALEWAVRSGKIATPTAASLQAFADNYLGLDCSGFATNYLIAAGRHDNDANFVLNRGAASFYSLGSAVNDSRDVKQGDLLVWMNGNEAAKGGEAHIVVVESYFAMSMMGGNLRIVEATPNGSAVPKILDSMCDVVRIAERGDKQRGNSVMQLQIRRFGNPHNWVSVMRP